jgi:beta-glucosidase
MNEYLDSTLPIERRVEDLIAELNVAQRGITHFNVLGGEDSAAVARWHNTLQEMAESTRLGIPVTLSTDPRHGFRSSPFTGQSQASLSRWPETTGIAAIGTIDAAREYGEVVRRELLTMGIRVGRAASEPSARTPSALRS